MQDNLIRKQYASACRTLTGGNVDFRADRLPITDNFPQWTSKGKIGPFMWRALTSVYVPGFTLVDSTKKQYNNHHLSCTHRGGNGMASLILNSIHEDNELNAILQDVRIVNTDIMYNGQTGGPFIRGINYYLKNYLDNYDEDIFYLEGSTTLGMNNVKGQDLVFVFPLLDANSMNQFVHLAYTCIQMGANTVVPIFVTRMMQDSEGNFPSCLPAEFGFPAPPRGFSFRELVDMDDDPFGDITL